MSCDGDHLELSYNVNLHMSAIVTILNFSSTQVVKYNKQKFAEHAQHPWNIPVKFVFQIVQRFLRRKQKYEMLTNDAEEDKDRHKVTNIAQMDIKRAL